jgi:hypothetical protein
MADLVVTLSGDDAKLLAVMRRTVEQQIRIEEGFKKVKTASTEANAEAKKIGDGMKDIADNAKSWSSGLKAGVADVTGELLQFMDKQKEVQKQTLEFTKAIAQSQSGASKNLTGLTTTEKQEVFLRVKAIQKEVGFGDQKTITDAYGSSMGVAEGSNATKIAMVDEAVRAAAPFSRLEPENLKQISRASLNIGRVTGVKDPKENIAFLTSASGAAFVDDNAMVAKNLTPAVVAGMAYYRKQDPKEAATQIAAVYGGMTKAGADDTGDSSSTGTIDLISRMAAVFEHRQDIDPGTVAGRLKLIQDRPELRAHLFSKNWGEQRFKAAYKEITDPNSKIGKEIFENMKQISFERAVYDQQVAEESALTPEMVTATFAAKQEGKMQLAMKNENANKETIRQMVDTTLRKNRKPGLGAAADYVYDTLIPEGVNFMGMSIKAPLRHDVAASFGSDLDMIEAGKDELQRRKAALGLTTRARIWGLSEEDKKKSANLDETIAELDKMREAVIKVRDEMEKLSTGRLANGLERSAVAAERQADANKTHAKQKAAASASGE